MITLVGRGCILYKLSIVTKFHSEPRYPLGGSELLRWVHTLDTSSFGMKASTEPSFPDPSRWGNPLGRECVILDRNEGLAYFPGYSSWFRCLFSGISSVCTGPVLLCSRLRPPSVGLITCRMFFPS